MKASDVECFIKSELPKEILFFRKLVISVSDLSVFLAACTKP